MSETIVPFLGKKRIIYAGGGSIGAGKTTVMYSLHQRLFTKCRFFGNPMLIFEKVVGEPEFEDYYSKIKELAFTVQMHALNAKYELYLHALHGLNSSLFDASKFPDISAVLIGLCDQSILADYAFALNHKRSGNITEDDFKIYQKRFDEIVEDLNKKDILERVLWLKVSPEEALRRINTRKRNHEVGKISLDYLKSLEVVQKDVFSNPPPCVEVYEIDWETPNKAADDIKISNGVFNDVSIFAALNYYERAA